MSALHRKALRKRALRYLVFSAVLGVCGGIYEAFSFGVYSPYMALAFFIPLTLGAFFCFLLSFPAPHIPNATSFLWKAAICTLTAGSVIQGVLEIYGTTNPLTKVYPVAAMLLAGAAGICLIPALLKGEAA